MSRGLLVLLALPLAAGCFPEVDKDGAGRSDSGADERQDSDGDGFSAEEDCDDADPTVHPGATEVCDGKDNDCDGSIDPETAADAVVWYVDSDTDGYGDPTQTGQACVPPAGTVDNANDCDDTNPLANPDATEVCDAADNDCDGLVDDDDPDLDDVLTFYYADQDGDSWGDENAVVEACSAPPNHLESVGDCDDTDADVNPDAQEICDDLDNDCDGLIDDADDSNDPASIRDFYPDADGDGFGAGEWAFEGCSGMEGYAANNDDCDDTDLMVHPDATEVCDELDVDENCNGTSDDADSGLDATTTSSWYVDADEDGYGDNDDPGTLACDDPSTETELWSSSDTDCDDDDASVNPDATEVCDDDDVDEDCDGLVDDADTDTDTDTQSEWTLDADEDGYGDQSATSTLACDAPSTGTDTYVDNATDCDDSDGAIHPGATEECDEFDVDEDCDGLIDDADDSVDPSGTTTWYTDTDSDGYGDSADPGTAFCDAPASGYAATDDDCDDTDFEVNPGAQEVCSASDDDCDASTSQDSMARFVETGGTETDLSSSWAAGTSTTPVVWSSSADGVLWVCADTWYVNLSVNGDAVDILGPDGATSTILDGAETDTVVTVSSRSTVLMSGLTLQGGAEVDGAGLHVDSATVHIEDTVFTDNIATALGGAVYALDSNLTLTSTTIDLNEAASGAGIYIDGGDADPIVLDTCIVSDNAATTRGGGLFIKGGAEVELLDTEVSGNTAGEHGGGIYFDNGVLDLDTCAIESNTATTDGGGIYAKDTMNVVDTPFHSNTVGDDGGGLYIDLSKNEDVVIAGSIASSTAASSTDISTNTASDKGDAVYVKINNKTPTGTVTITTVDFGTDDLYSDTKNNTTLTPGDGASLSCTHNAGCQ